MAVAKFDQRIYGTRSKKRKLLKQHQVLSQCHHDAGMPLWSFYFPILLGASLIKMKFALWFRINQNDICTYIQIQHWAKHFNYCIIFNQSIYLNFNTYYKYCRLPPSSYFTSWFLNVFFTLRKYVADNIDKILVRNNFQRFRKRLIILTTPWNKWV